MAGFVGGVLLGFILGGISMAHHVDEKYIPDCEKDLPRNQECELTAVPIKVIGDKS